MIEDDLRQSFEHLDEFLDSHVSSNAPYRLSRGSLRAQHAVVVNPTLTHKFVRLGVGHRDVGRSSQRDEMQLMSHASAVRETRLVAPFLLDQLS